MKNKPNFVVGDCVEWTSQAGSYWKTKQGTVVAIVDAGQDPRSFSFQGDFGFSRNEKSYLVRVGNKSKVYWPRTSKLKLIPA